MQMILESIDEIAITKQKDVLCLDFCAHHRKDETDKDWRLEFDWRREPLRQQTINWLDLNNIDWQPCNINALARIYEGWIYVDVPVDEENDDYKKLQAYLSNTVDEVRYWQVSQYIISLDYAENMQRVEFESALIKKRYKIEGVYIVHVNRPHRRLHIRELTDIAGYQYGSSEFLARERLAIIEAIGLQKILELLQEYDGIKDGGVIDIQALEEMAIKEIV